jgi:hypothetical protein
MTPDIDAQRADELDAAITALLTRRDATLPDGGAAARATPDTPETQLLGALAHLNSLIEPKADFAADLEARLLAAPAPPAPSELPARDGHDGHNGRVRPRSGRLPLWRWWLPLAAMVLLTLLLVPQARADLQSLIRVGAVRIGLAQPPHATPRLGSAATPTPTPLDSPLDLAGETTLQQARAQAGFPLLLPTYPPDLGQPQHVFLQNLNGPMVALVWVDAAQPSRVRLALFEMSNRLYVDKSGAEVVAQTTVHGQQALWTQGPYIVQVLVNGQVVDDTRRLVTGHVLIWTDNGITYRLETDQPLDVAVRIAESLR